MTSLLEPSIVRAGGKPPGETYQGVPDAPEPRQPAEDEAEPEA